MTHDVYRLSLTSDNLARAVADYKTRHGRIPGRLTVHKTQIAAAAALLAGGVKIISVVGSGGCLATEFWLGAALEYRHEKTSETQAAAANPSVDAARARLPDMPSVQVQSRQPALPL